MRSFNMNRTQAVCGRSFVLPTIKPSTLLEDSNASGQHRTQAWGYEKRHRSAD